MFVKDAPLLGGGDQIGAGLGSIGGDVPVPELETEGPVVRAGAVLRRARGGLAGGLLDWKEPGTGQQQHGRPHHTLQGRGEGSPYVIIQPGDSPPAQLARSTLEV